MRDYIYVLVYHYVLEDGSIDPDNPWLSFKHMRIQAASLHEAYGKGLLATGGTKDWEQGVNDYVIEL